MRLLCEGFGPLARPAAGAGLFIAQILAVPPSAAQDNFTANDNGSTWFAGAYSFSDELGGFRITGASGSGSKDDPFVISEELFSASPVTLIIRATTPIRPFDLSGFYASGFMHMRIEALNNSGQGWVEFAFELEEIYKQPSLFGDGLSFDQRRSDSDNISSGSFRHFSRDFEPYDRLLFQEGAVDPLEVGGFSFFITDFTPKEQFYLVQDPRIPFS